MSYGLDCFDYSWARPDPKLMDQAGIKVVCRYLWDSENDVLECVRRFDYPDFRDRLS